MWHWENQGSWVLVGCLDSMKGSEACLPAGSCRVETRDIESPAAHKMEVLHEWMNVMWYIYK